MPNGGEASPIIAKALGAPLPKPPSSEEAAPPEPPKRFGPPRDQDRYREPRRPTTGPWGSTCREQPSIRKETGRSKHPRHRDRLPLGPLWGGVLRSAHRGETRWSLRLIRRPRLADRGQTRGSLTPSTEESPGPRDSPGLATGTESVCFSFQRREVPGVLPFPGAAGRAIGVDGACGDAPSGSSHAPAGGDRARMIGATRVIRDIRRLNLISPSTFSRIDLLFRVKAELATPRSNPGTRCSRPLEEFGEFRIGE